jgi:hypothetical protein
MNFRCASVLQARNSDVYMGSIQELAAGVTKGLNGTVFAYGSTGSGKTHTMVGEWQAPWKVEQQEQQQEQQQQQQQQAAVREGAGHSQTLVWLQRW